MEPEKCRNGTLKIKWGKENIDLDLEQSDTFDSFQAKLYSLTFVPLETQKLSWKGKKISDQSSYEIIDLKTSNKMGLIGKAEDKVVDYDLVKQKVFIEDLTPEERAKFLKENFGEVLPFGLVNLGNTCYVNSCVQVLRKIPELRKAIDEAGNSFDAPGAMLTSATKRVFDQLETSGDSVTPKEFISTFMTVFPEFGEQDPHGGGFKQQDADEAFQKMLMMMDPYISKEKPLIDDLFKFQVEYDIFNTENEDEPHNSIVEDMTKLPCIIDNQDNPINVLSEGLHAGLKGEIEKHSTLENRNCIFHRIGKLISLPKYLMVQEIRFVWKQKDIGTMTDARKAKILRAVAFPKVLDLQPYCSQDLSARLQTGKDYQQRLDAAKTEKDKAAFEDFKAEFIKRDPDADTLKITKAFKKSKADDEVAEMEENLWRDHGTGVETGEYQLVGVITHKGRSADSGHYLGWTQSKGDIWHKYDDDLVTQVKIDDIMALRGGGDWHIAYCLVYRKLELPKEATN